MAFVLRSSRILSRHALHIQPRALIRQTQLRNTSLNLPVQSIRCFSYSSRLLQQATAAVEKDAEFTNFEHLSGTIHQSILDTITQDLKLKTMTEVQQRTLQEALAGHDIVAQARTGTGKTIGFLLPIIQRILADNPDLVDSRRRASSKDVSSIIISPTRELAEQIAIEAKRLVAKTGIKIQLAVGGTGKREMLQKTRYEGCHLLIGTPGRLHDILSDQYSGIDTPQLRSFVLDEADRLLDIGFGPVIEDIKRLLPPPSQSPRQNMMFSATISEEVIQLTRHTLNKNFKFVQCVDPNEEPTHHNVPQHLSLLPGYENYTPALVELIEREYQDGAKPFKAIIFYNSSNNTAYGAAVLGKVLRGSKLPVLEIHGQLSQQQRTRVSETFRRCESGLLVSTDVTARGLDFPNVTHVIQVGVPIMNPRDTYIHRLGRTARAGKEGQGWLFVTDIEAPLAQHNLSGLPLQRDETLESSKIDFARSDSVPEGAQQWFKSVQEAARLVPYKIKADVYRNFLKPSGRVNKQNLARRANLFAQIEFGMSEPPAIDAKFASHASLSESDGVRIQSGFNENRSSSGGQGFGGRGFGGRGSGGRNGGFGGRGGSQFERARDDSFKRHSDNQRW